MEPPDPPSPNRSKGRARFLHRALPPPASAGPAVRCLFLDRNGAGWAERDVMLDCRPARYVRLELALDVNGRMLKRTWLDLGDDRAGRAVYAEQTPEPWQDAVTVPYRKRMKAEEWPE